MGVHRKGFARFSTLVATFGTAVGHHGGKRSAACTDLSTGGTTCCAVLTVHQACQVFLLAIGQQVRAMGRTVIARSLAVRARFRTLLQHGVGFRFCRLRRTGEHIHTDDRKTHRQNHRTDSAGHSILHDQTFSSESVISTPASEIDVSIRVTETKKTDVEEHTQAFPNVGLLRNEPPRHGRVALYQVFRFTANRLTQ